jgi:hypothetical protein
MDPFRVRIHDELRRATAERDWPPAARSEGLLVRWGRRVGHLAGWVLVQLLGRGGQR